MSYQTGTATNVDDLLTKLSTFAVANGWTENKKVAGSGNGHSSELYLSKGVSFFQLEAVVDSSHPNEYQDSLQNIDNPGLRLYGSTGHDGGLAISAQPNTSNYTEVTWLFPNMTAYHFFTDSAKTYLHVVVEVLANDFRHFAIGLVNKTGAYTGGEYVIGHRWDHALAIDDPGNAAHLKCFLGEGGSDNLSNKFHCNVDGVRWKRYRGTTNQQSIVMAWNGEGDNGTFLSSLIHGDSQYSSASPNTFNAVTPLHQIPAGFVIRSATYWAPIGHFEDIRAVNIKNIVPSSTITLGSDDYLVFPIVTKNSPALRNSLPNSGWMGIAYLKVP